MKQQTPIAASPCSTIKTTRSENSPAKKPTKVRPNIKQTEAVFEVVFSHPRRLFLLELDTIDQLPMK
ncbi:MAG: hypothetical protein AAF696_29320 [Bacteroidota bacterium]